MDGHLVEQQDPGVLQDGARYGYPLLLAAAQLDAALAHLLAASQSPRQGLHIRIQQPLHVHPHSCGFYIGVMTSVNSRLT